EAESDRGQALEKEEPLPSRETESTTESEQPPRDGAPDHTRHGYCHRYQAKSPSPLRFRKPVAEIVHPPGRKASLGNSEQESKCIEAGRTPYEHHRRGQQPPRDHDPGDPNPSAHAGEDQIARDLEQDVTQKKDPRTEPVNGGAEPEVLVHLERGEAH